MLWLYFIGGWLAPIIMYYTLPKKSRVSIYIGAILIAVLALALRCAILGAPQMAFKNAGFPYH